LVEARRDVYSPDAPRFKRRLIWSESRPDDIFLSPAALLTETVAPLPSPPSHILNDPLLQTALESCRAFIKVTTPFNIPRLRTLLYDHPNQPFVTSVLHGLEHGFWPLDEGDWKAEQLEQCANFATEDQDLTAIRAFRDKKILADRWSLPIPCLTRA